MNDLIFLIQQVDSSDIDAVDYVCIRIESLYADIIDADLNGHYVHPQVIRKVFECWKLFQDEEEECIIPGRPVIEIPVTILECLMLHCVLVRTPHVGRVLNNS